MRPILISLIVLINYTVIAQKKPLDHTVYDGWQSIGEREISKDGKWVVYSVDTQEGDNELFLQSADGTYSKKIPRGYYANFTYDSRFLITKIKPFFQDTRQAKIKKKKPEEMPKDSLVIINLEKDSVWKIPRVKGYQIPEKGAGWIAYQLEKPLVLPSKKTSTNLSNKEADSLSRAIDSLHIVIENLRSAVNGGKTKDGEMDAEGDESVTTPTDTGSDMILLNLTNGSSTLFKNTTEYLWNEKGNKLIIDQSKDPKDSTTMAKVLLHDLQKSFTHLLSKGGNDFKNFIFSKDGSQLAYVAERDAKPKELLKFYKLWYYKEGMDTATMLIEKSSVGMKLGMTISEFGALEFSKSGRRLFFPSAVMQAPKDTSLIEIDQVKLDIWHYNDDYLQTQQLFRLQKDLQENFLTVYDFNTQKIEQLESRELPTVYKTDEGDGENFIGVTDFGKRVESQWTGFTKKDIYSVHVSDASKKLIRKDLAGVITSSYVSFTGKYILWYDYKARGYFISNGIDSAKNITASLKLPLYDEENDEPGDPSPYGIMGWHEGDSALYLYDRYDVWKIDPAGLNKPINLSRGIGRKNKTSFRYYLRDPERKFISSADRPLFRKFNPVTKITSLAYIGLDGKDLYEIGLQQKQLTIRSSYGLKEISDDGKLLLVLQSFVTTPDLFLANLNMVGPMNETQKKVEIYDLKLSSINPQQKEYNWGKAEIYKWKTFTGKQGEGVLYTPADFDPMKKYPLILYFYDRLTDSMNNYLPPAPTPSRLNITFFVSRGYLVMTPDIRYTVGHPAQSAYDFIVSGAKDLAKHSWVDAKNMGIQGQSWGGIQVAQLITMTDVFKAAWAGAPVANMTSAYGGIRWESGANRQMQYEKQQSRIGATLWQRPDLYIENSPLFHLPKVTTPLVIMSNDADGAVPWYQGIELFTAMRRLNKKVWLLNYNGEAHNLVQRKNRKDIQIREQQYFDWLLKGEKAPSWITDGLPAVKKGRELGLD